MAGADRATCPRCGAVSSAGTSAGLCLRCLGSNTRRNLTERRPVDRSPPRRRAGRKLALTLISAVAAIGAMLVGSLWSAHKQTPHMSDAEVCFTRGVELQREGKLDDAIAAYREAIRITPDFAESHFALGVALFRQGNRKQAIEPLREAIRITPDDGDAYMTLGLALKAQGRLKEAVAAYREAIRVTPNLADAHYALGLTLKTQGKLKEAVAELRNARDHCQPGSALAPFIERSLTGSDH